MTRFNLSRWIVVATALAVGLFINCNRASAVIVDVLAGVNYTSETGFSALGNENTVHPTLTFTDGATNPTTTAVTGTFYYLNAAASPIVTYDLGSAERVNTFGIWEGFGTGGGSTNNPAFPSRGTVARLNVDFSNDPTFATGVTTDVINLPNPSSGNVGAYFESASIPSVTAEYVRFDFLTGHYYLTPNDGNGFATVSQLDLSFVPEPASLGLIGVGGLMLLRRRRVAAQFLSSSNTI